MFNLNKIRDETDVTGADTWENHNYENIPTKAIIFHLQFLDDTGTRTLANILTQVGSVLQIKDKSHGLIVDYAQIADWFYYQWYKRQHPPKIHGHNDTTDVGAFTLAVQFGDWSNPHQGLQNPKGLVTKLTSPASGNSIDNEKLSIYQVTQPNAKYTEFIKHERVSFTPSSSAWAKLSMPIKPLSKKILLALLFHTTGRDDVATTLTLTIAKLAFHADGIKRIGNHNADFWINLFAPAGKEAGNAYETGLTYPSTYMPIDFVKLNGGRPFIPSEHGITRSLKMDIYSEDGSAVRLNQYSLVRN